MWSEKRFRWYLFFGMSLSRCISVLSHFSKLFLKHLIRRQVGLEASVSSKFYILNEILLCPALFWVTLEIWLCTTEEMKTHFPSKFWHKWTLNHMTNQLVPLLKSVELHFFLHISRQHLTSPKLVDMTE